MDKTELPARIPTRTSLSRDGVHPAVHARFSAIADASAGGETITVAAFGTFSTTSQPTRRSPNSHTAENITTATSNTPFFKTGRIFPDAVD